MTTQELVVNEDFVSFVSEFQTGGWVGTSIGVYKRETAVGILCP